jgi:hypothetical protein
VKSFLDNFAAILGTATIALLLVSVCHEYGYFWIVGSRLQTFVSTTDYFSNSILWLPWIAFALYAYLDWDVLMGRRRYGFGWNWKTATWFAFIFGSPIAGLFLLDEFWIFSLIIPGILAWVLVASNRLPFSNSDSELERMAYRAMLIAPIVAAISFGYGVTQGQSALKTFDEPYKLELKDLGTINRVLLRTFEKGILVRDTIDDRIEFINFEQVRRLSRFAPPERKVPVSCSWLRVNCPQPFKAD